VRILRRIKVVLTDFDGVLVDSYSCLPEIYREIGKMAGVPLSRLEQFVERAIEYEDIEDARKNYDHRKWWPRLFREFAIDVNENIINNLADLFWRMRKKRSTIIRGAKEFLEFITRQGIKVIVLAGNDGKRGLKKLRVESSPLAKFFEEIIIVGDDVEDRPSAVIDISRRYGVAFGEILFIDDKPDPINEIHDACPNISTVKVNYRGILKRSWQGNCRADINVDNLKELLALILNQKDS